MKGANIGYVPVTRADLKLSLEGCPIIPIYDDLKKTENTGDSFFSQTCVLIEKISENMCFPEKFQ
jgi:hypothetical protein